MGKAQSKRSVDITQEGKEGVVVEGESGKVAKIDDVDQLKPQLNGDTNHTESAVSYMCSLLTSISLDSRKQ